MMLNTLHRNYNMPSYADYYGGGRSGGQRAAQFPYDYIPPQPYEGPGNFDLRNQYNSGMGDFLSQQYRSKYKLPRRKKPTPYGNTPEQAQGMGMANPVPYDSYPGMYSQYGSVGGNAPAYPAQGRSPLLGY
jgi:hypothetical protein